MLKWISTIVLAAAFISMISGCANYPDDYPMEEQSFPPQGEANEVAAPVSLYPPRVIDQVVDTEEEYIPRVPVVALTFDDGPSRHTSRILDVLEQYDGRATFFVLGYRVEPHRDVIMRAANMGNEIVNHTWSHSDLTSISQEEVVAQIQSTSAAIEAITGYSPRFYRPPFGRTNSSVRYVSTGLGYAIVNWTLDTLDWRYRDADRIYDTIMSEVEDGAVILLHDIHITTAEAMERVIPSLIAKGFKLVTVSEVLDYLYGDLEPGRIYGKIYDDELLEELLLEELLLEELYYTNWDS